MMFYNKQVRSKEKIMNIVKVQSSYNGADLTIHNQKPHSLMKKTVATAAIGAGTYAGYKKIASSPELTKKLAGFFNKITGPLMKGKSKNLLTNKGKVGIMLAAAATLLAGLTANRISYNKGRAAGKEECGKNLREIGVCYSTTA